MEELLGNVFNVSKRFATAKSVEVGDFKTKDEAINAMIEHYRTNAKRGNFSYVISECELEEIGGVVYRKLTLSLCGTDKQFYHRYSKNELENWGETNVKI